MRGRILQNSFVGGEIAPELYSRVDVAAYFKGAAVLQNFLVKKTGGIIKRPGVKLGHKVPRVFDFAGAARRVVIIPYRQDVGAGGVIVLEQEGVKDADGESWDDVRVMGYYLNIYCIVNGGRVENKVELPPFNFGESLRWQQVGDTFYFSSTGVSGDYEVFLTLKVNPYSESLTVGALEASVAPGEPYSISTTLTGGDVWKGKDPVKMYKYAVYVKSGGVLSAPKKASRQADASWPAGGGIRITVRVRQPWPDEVICAKQGGAAYGAIFTVDGESYNSQGTSGGAPYREYVFEDQNHIPGELVGWQTDLFEGAAPMGEQVAVWQQRLVLAGLADAPFSLVLSRAGDFGSFIANRPMADDDPFRLTLPVEGYEKIRHLVAFRDVLLVFTDGGVWRIYASSTAEGVGPRTTRVEQINSIGAADAIKPVKVGVGVVYVGVDRRTVYRLMYNLEQDMIMPQEISVLARHLTEGEGRQIKQMAYQTYPESVIWMLLDDGSLISVTLQEEHEVVAWCRHELPGRMVVGTGAEEREVELVLDSIVATESMSEPGVSDVVVLLRDVVSDEAAEEEGDEIGVWLGVLRSGAVRDYEGSGMVREIVGEVVMLRPESPERSIQGMIKGVLDCHLRVRGTERLAVVNAAGGVDEVVAVDSAGEAYSGDVKVVPRGVWDTDGQMKLVSSAGGCEVLGVTWEVEVAG